MHFIIFEAVPYVDCVVFIIFTKDKLTIKLLSQRRFPDDHQGPARQIPEISGQAPMLCLIKAIHHINIAVIIEHTVIGWVQEHKIAFPRHIKYLPVINIEQLCALKQVAVLLCDQPCIKIGIPPKGDVVFAVIVIPYHAGIGGFVDEKI